MYQKRMAEIEARKAEIAKEIAQADEARTQELDAEVDGLNQELAMLRAKQAVAGKVKPLPDGGKPVDADLEARAAEMKNSGKITLTAQEVRRGLVAPIQRATTIATDSLAKPTGVGQNVEGTFNVVSSIVDEVRVMDCEGCGEWSEPYVSANAAAGARTDGTAATASDPTFRVASIRPNLVNVTSYVSKNIEKLTPVNYVAKVQEIALVALRAKVGALIVNGDGSNFYGIKTATNTKSEAIYDTLTMALDSSKKGVIDEKTLRKIVLSYGGDENVGASARLYLNKSDLIAFGDVRGSDKKPVYEITPDAGNPNTGIIKDGGLAVPYTINSNLTALAGTAQSNTAVTNTMVYGDPMNYELGLFGDYTIEVSKDYKFAEGLLTVMGEVLAGGNLIKHHGFLVCQIAKGTA